MEREEKEKRLERERQASAATDRLRDIQFATQQIEGPVAAASSRVMSEGEAEMWEDFRMNGADFSAGDEAEDPEARRRQFQAEAEIFGLWNPEATARKLGFVDDGLGDEEDDEDDFLGEFLRNFGEFCCPSRVGRERSEKAKLVCGHMITTVPNWDDGHFALAGPSWPARRPLCSFH
jgi:hypothetical protein